MQRLKDAVPLSGDRLAAAAARHLTLHAEYAKRRTFARNMERPPANVYPAWCKPTRQSKPQPFETDGCLPGMEPFYKQYLATRKGR